VSGTLRILPRLHLRVKRATRITRDMGEFSMPVLDGKQNITLRLSRETIRKARVLAAQRSTSISGLLTSQIEQLANSDDEYERAMDRAFSLMKEGFHLGGVHQLDRDSLHER
jgi:hypothetical protein